MFNKSVEFFGDLVSFAVAAYGHFFNGDSLKNNLKKASKKNETNPNFTAVQADKFDDKYQPIHQQENVGGNGFSAVLFKDKETNRHVLAIRGTDQEWYDLTIAGAGSIFPNGFANTQAVEMYRYYRKLTTEGWKPVDLWDFLDIQIADLRYKFINLLV